MKSLKFDEKLVEKVLNGTKTATWRLWDDKDLQQGEEVMFVHGEDRKPFVKVKLISVWEKKFGELTEEDGNGHESYGERNLYEVYSQYYGKEVLPDSPIKIIRFEILERY